MASGYDDWAKGLDASSASSASRAASRAAPEEALDVSTLSKATEAWFSTAESDVVVEAAIARAVDREGQGSNMRNLSVEFLEAACALVMRELPPGIGEELPAPDAEFVHSALGQVMPDALGRGGIQDAAQMVMAVQVVFLQLAASADALRAMVAADPDNPAWNQLHK
jgi:hypothetical protein